MGITVARMERSVIRGISPAFRFAPCGLRSYEARQMLPTRGRRVAGLRGLHQNLAQPLGREVLLHEGDAAVEGFAVVGNALAAELEPAHALEHDRLALGAGHFRGVAEAPVRVADAPVGERIEEIPAIVAAGRVKTR